MNPSCNEPPSRAGFHGNAIVATAYPIFLLLVAVLLLLESNYRPDGVPKFIALGDSIVGPGFWSSWLLLPFGILLAIGVRVAFKRRFIMTRSDCRRATVLLTLAGVCYILLLGSTVVLSLFRSEVVAVGTPSSSGCQIYATRQQVLSGAGGELFLRPSGESILAETGDRWAARALPDFDLNNYLEVSWEAETAVVRDVSGEDPNGFYYRGTERFSC